MKTKTEQIEIVQQSFREVLVDGEAFVDRFYTTMFEMFPDMQVYFANTDMPILRKKVLRSLIMIIDNLTHPEHLTVQLQELGQQHSENHNIKAQDYAKMGQALVKTMALTLPTTWNPQVEVAWVSAFADVSGLMLSNA